MLSMSTAVDTAAQSRGTHVDSSLANVAVAVGSEARSL